MESDLKEEIRGRNSMTQPQEAAMPSATLQARRPELTLRPPRSHQDKSAEWKEAK